MVSPTTYVTEVGKIIGKAYSQFFNHSYISYQGYIRFNYISLSTQEKQQSVINGGETVSA